MLDDLYQAETDAAINDLIQRPQAPKPQAAKFSAWRALAGPVRGAGVGANEGAGGMADIVGAFGQVLGATDARTSMFSPQTPEQKKQEAQARDQMLNRGLQFDTGDQFRSVAREWMPDPVTTHWSESLTFGLGRFATKAVGYTALAGPVGGAALTGLDEGLTAADELKQQGVDLQTRTTVGAVAGVAGAAGVLLPVAGKNLAQTAALVAAGGPGTFIGQQAATRAILANADYTQIANQYDPFDPVGLAVATLVPAGFGAMALRGAKLRDRMKPGDAPAGEPLRPDVQPAQDSVQTEPARPRPTPDHVDAARVEMLTQHIEGAGLHSAGDARAAAMHLDAFARAMDDLSTGRRVDVTAFVPVERLQVAQALDSFSQRLDSARTDLMAQAAQRAEPGAIRALQSELVDAQARLASLDDPAAIKSRAADLQQSDRLSFKQAMAQARKEFEAQTSDVRAQVDRIEGLLSRNAEGQQAFDALNLLDRQAADVARQRTQIDAPVTRQTPTAAAAKEAAATAQAQPKEPTANVQDAPQARTDAPAGAARQPDQAAQPQAADARGPGQDGAGTQGSGVSRAGGAAAEAAVVSQRLADIQAQFPDLTVQMDGMDKPMPLSDFLAQVQREAMEGTDFDIGGNDAPLMQVAASCFLLNG